MIVPMDEIALRYEVNEKDLAHGRRLKIGIFAAPPLLAGLPAAVFLVLMLIFGTTPPVAFVFLILALITGVAGLIAGLGLSGWFAYRRNAWTREMREKIAADGIRAEEVDWFRHELTAGEKRALKAVSAADPMLGDAYRETLASRLTASRIMRSSNRELQSMRKRQNKVKMLKAGSAKSVQAEIGKDIKKIENIRDEAKSLLAEAQTRLQTIEAAVVRNTSIADSVLVLKKLSARASELPLALENAKLTEEILAEIDADDLTFEDKTPHGKPGGVQNEVIGE